MEKKRRFYILQRWNPRSLIYIYDNMEDAILGKKVYESENSNIETTITEIDVDKSSDLFKVI